jgi:hypothetical protein
MNFTKIYNATLEKKDLRFSYKGEKFETFIDWEGDFCLTHYNPKYYSNGASGWNNPSIVANSWFVGDIEGLEKTVNEIIELVKQK